MDEQIKIFSTNLKEQMKKHGENITKLSRSTGIPISTVSDWVHGKKMPRSGNLQTLGQHYHVNWAYLTNEHSKEEIYEKSHTYNFFDSGLHAKLLSNVNPFNKNDIKKIPIPDLVMGKYAGDQEIFLTYINGESMNRIMPNHSLIAIKKYNSVVDLKDGDIIAFDDANEMCVKQFYKDYRSRTYSFNPNSTDSTFTPIIYRWEDAQEITIIGKIVTYVVNV